MDRFQILKGEKPPTIAEEKLKQGKDKLQKITDAYEAMKKSSDSVPSQEKQSTTTRVSPGVFTEFDIVNEDPYNQAELAWDLVAFEDMKKLRPPRNGR